ncbi:MAG: tetratricopeptide repeat protein [Nannocystaceae bacterium]
MTRSTPSDPEDALRQKLTAARREPDPVDRHAVLARVQQGLFDDARNPLQIGRFVVSHRLGAGASGVVYAAHDPKLDRKIALKVLRPDGDLDEQAHARLLREAQALARLSHPNVVAVHDVGDLDGRVFVAMELLEGGTLRRWLRASPRSTAEILEVFVQAGEGLAAAHAAGLVHRDFKPDNVLLDEQGRASVVDFGLAREQVDPGMSVIEAIATAEQPGEEADLRLTRTGTMLGTPAYMAPEQFAGRRADARTDQFSFCVSLFEALVGERPFEGNTLPALAMATQRGQVRPVAWHSVPSRIRRAVLRGLRPEPADRYPSMRALLTALQRDPWVVWRRRGLGAVALAAAVGTTWAVADDRVVLTAASAPCSGVEQHLAGIWDDPRREAVADGMRGSDHPSGAATWERVRSQLDDFGHAWVEARRDVCEARQLRREDSDDLLDRRQLCLDRALLALDAAAARLAEGDRETVARAQQLVPDREMLAHCSSEGVLDDGVSPPSDPRARERLRQVERGIVQTNSLWLAGKYSEALARVQPLIVEAAALDHPPTHARALLELAAVYTQTQRPREAVEALVQALAQAERGRADRTRVLSYALLAKRLADLQQFEEARRIAPLTEAVYDRLSPTPVGAAARVHLLWGQLEWMEGHYEAAIERYTEAIDSSAEVPEDEADAIVMAGLHSEAVGHRGATALEAQHYARALEDLEHAAVLRERIVGPDHPEMAALHTNLGNCYLRQGDLTRAEQELRRALEIREHHLGPDHEMLANPISSLGAVVMQQGDSEAALGHFRRALELLRTHRGPSDPQLAFTLHNMALAHVRLEQPEPALELVQQALEIRREALGPTHVRSLDSMYQLGYVQQTAGQREAAESTFTEYLALLVEHRPEDTTARTFALLALSDIALGQKRLPQAQDYLEQARKQLATDDVEHPDLRAGVAFNLALALDRQRRSPARALALATEALAEVRDSGKREEIEAWLADHQGPGIDP